MNVRTDPGHKKSHELTEGEVQGLGREVSDDVGGVSSPEGDHTLLLVGTAEGITDAFVGGGKTALLDLGKCDVSDSEGADEKWALPSHPGSEQAA